jgi:hypothetical protein
MRATAPQAALPSAVGPLHGRDHPSDLDAHALQQRSAVTAVMAVDIGPLRTNTGRPSNADIRFEPRRHSLRASKLRTRVLLPSVDTKVAMLHLFRHIKRNGNSSFPLTLRSVSLQQFPLGRKRKRVARGCLAARDETTTGIEIYLYGARTGESFGGLRLTYRHRICDRDERAIPDPD